LTFSARLATLDDLKAGIDKFVDIYDWNSAAQVIEDFIKNNGDTGKRAFELLGDCYYNLAFQQNTRDEFKMVILRAKETFEKVETPGDLRWKAKAAYCAYWASEDPEARTSMILDECIPSMRQTISWINSTEESVSEKVRARDYAELLTYYAETRFLVRDRDSDIELLEEMTSLIEEVLVQFSGKNPDAESLIALSLACGPLNFGIQETQMIDQNRRKRISDNFHEFAKNVIQSAEQTNNAKLLARAYVFSGARKIQSGNSSDALEFFTRARAYAENTGDRLLIGWIGEMQAWAAQFLVASKVDSPDLRKELMNRQFDFCRVAIENLKITRGEIYLWSTYYLVWNQINFARDSPMLGEKIAYIDRAIEIGRAGFEEEKSVPAFRNLEQVVSEALRYKSQLTQDARKQTELLTESATLISGVVELKERLSPDRSEWDLGVVHHYLGVVEADLATFESTISEKDSTLKRGLISLKSAVDICGKTPFGRGAGWGVLLVYSENLANTFFKLYKLTAEESDAQATIDACEEVTRLCLEHKVPERAAPQFWRIAELFDSLGRYENSSASFSKASELYRSGSKNQKGLERTFSELSIYMEAWCSIEEARVFHSDEKYQLSSEKLKEASDNLSRTESFKHLAKHYQAFSKVEEAEELSRKESNVEAATAFEIAHDFFEESRDELTALSKERSSDDDELMSWAMLSESRAKYCLARKHLDEAKTLDKNGEVKQSMTKYRSASEGLKQLVRESKRGEDRMDVEALSLACDGWATMKDAEYSASPELYDKAAEIFMQAKDKKVGQKFVLSCLANSSICEAFAIGMKFKKSRDPALYSEIKNHLGAASQYYEEAGFEIASDWTRATEALFDALAYLAGAEREIDPQKKTQLYHLAEKHLELSARRYGDIGYDKKRQEVLRHLKTARENRELLISPMDALSRNPTVSVTPVNFTRDQAVGLERFEVANLTGNVNLSVKSTNVGSALRIDIDIANVGKTPALLMKLDNIAPSQAFEVEPEKNPHHFLEGGNAIGVDLKGKRLEYLKAHEMSLHFIAKNKGSYDIKPKILFVDELGKYRSYEFEPQTVEVKELGFMGWAKGK
jgi:tetratricopeptide (TPR) repeat protein